MRIFVLLFIAIFINASDVEVKGNIGVEYKKQNFTNPFANDIENKAIYTQIEFKNEFEDYLGVLKIEALKDRDDNDRNYIKVNELFIQKEAENYDLRVGRDIKFWGALELHNITDIYNKKNIKFDPYDKDKKLGTDGITYKYFIEDEETLNTMVTNVDDIINFYLQYSGSRDFIGSLDFSLIVQNNKDENRLLTYNTLLNDDTLYKLELSYLNSKTQDYYEGGLGIEHTLYGVIGAKDLGLIWEYYKSDRKGINQLLYQDDLFLGVRLTFNDVDSSDIVTGVIKDLDDKQNSYSIEYNTRIDDMFKTKLKYIKNDSFDLLSIQVGYYF